LAFTRQGLRFADPATERAYRDWHLDEAIPYTRIGMQTSIVGWIAATLVFGATVDGFLAGEGQGRVPVLRSPRPGSRPSHRSRG
jgi:hypothetical protein